MGNGAAKNFYFTYSYQRDRLYKDLAEVFVDDPKNKLIVRNIARLKEILTVRPDLSAIATQELANDFLPTCLQAAQLEYQRLLSLYLEHMRLKSVLCRVGAVACPLGHFCEKIEEGKCEICTHKFDSGYFCTFCNYGMCEACSVIYCLEGHAMALWTHAESVHKCSVCHQNPITSGYRCHICYTNICDACTDKAGRIIVQRKIREDLASFLNYFQSHATESSVANDTIIQHHQDLIDHPFPTVIDLMAKRVLYGRLKQVVQAQVYIFKITKEIGRLRGIITMDAWSSAPCRRESVREGYFVVDEIKRLTTFIRVRLESKMPEVRCSHCVACPLGHGMQSYIGCPQIYLARNKQSQKKKMQSIKEVVEEDDDEDDDDDGEERSSEDSDSESESSEDGHSIYSENYNGSTTDASVESSTIDTIEGGMLSVNSADRVSLLNPPKCRICHRKSNKGYHCSLCEYEICITCSEIYCTMGHRMAIWNAPNTNIEIPESTAEKFMHSSASFDASEGSPKKPSAILSTLKETDFEDDDDITEGDKSIGKMFDLSSIAESSSILSSPPVVETKFSCALCHAPNINSGYNCTICPHPIAYLCDKCTSIEGRKSIRKKWDDELDDIMRFMRTERLLSDICRKFQWQTKHVIVGVGRLLEHLAEMQEWHRKAKLQIKYKQIIDDIKDIRKFLLSYPDICAISRREQAWTPDYVYETKKDAKKELNRLHSLIHISDELKSYEHRVENRFACPLGHGTCAIPNFYHLSKLYKQAAALRLRAIPPDQLVPPKQEADNGENNAAGDVHEFTDNNNNVDYITSKMNPSNKSDYILANTSDYELPPLHSMDLGSYDYFGETIKVSICCAICNTQDLIDGRFCLYCEYITCSTCSVIYCRQGHPTRIWTLPDAMKLSCSVCLKGCISSGYRCLECEVDICDECTAKKTRAGMQLWPMREGVKIMQYFESVRFQSDIARNYYRRYGNGVLKDWEDEDKIRVDAEAAEATARAKRAAEVASASSKMSKKEKVRTSNANNTSMGGFSYKSAAVRQAIEESNAAVEQEAKAKAAAEALPKILGPIGKAGAPVALPLHPGGSMSHTCRVLLELRTAKILVDEEIGLKSMRTIQSGRVATKRLAVPKAWGSDL